MKTTNNIQEELQHIAPSIVNLQNSKPFSVPNNYFSDLSNEVLFKINCPTISSNYLIKANAYLVPNNYFGSFQSQIIPFIHAQKRHISDIDYELETVAPFLNSIKKNNVYSLPENYFESKNNFKQIQSTSNTPTLSFKRKWFLYVAAAAFTGLTLLGVFNFLGNSSNKININTELAKTNEDELTEFLDNQTTPIFFSQQSDEEIFGIFEGTDTEDLIFYLKQQPQKDESLIEGI